ncbi:hypothetical protein B0T14DRAFT_509233 [Immersiella caudata]|uniref:Uncharacterized protein n=1 Tax=Immersiella caudata TaxID=314043 RepID=A0AA40C662_9PEZI|nr:hypothetical protein B0T14DRAFT_509233 [Immersiella caudata]
MRWHDAHAQEYVNPPAVAHIVTNHVTMGVSARLGHPGGRFSGRLNEDALRKVLLVTQCLSA